MAAVRIGPRGLDAANQQQLDLVARGLVVEGEVWAQDLRAIVGANRVLYADLRGPLQQLPAGPAGGGFAVDIRELGGMYAQQIYLVATERGLGVNSSGRLVALQGHLTLSSAGDLRVRDAHAQQDLKLTAQGRLDASGTLRAGGDLLLDATSVQGQGGTLEADGRVGIRAERIALDKQSLAAAGRIDIAASGDLSLTGSSVSTRESLHATSGAATDLSGSRAWAVDAIALASAGDLLTDRAQLAAPRLQLRAGGAYANRGGQLLARSPVPGDEETDTSLELHAASIDNTGGQLLAQDKLSLTATAGTLDNSEGTIAGGHVQLHGVEQLANRGGRLYVDNALRLRALDNAGGLVDSTASLTVDASGRTVDNRGGAIIAKGPLALQAQHLDNAGGLLATSGDARLSIADAFDNAGGVLRANGHLDAQALRTDNRGGVIAGLQSVALAGDDLDNDAGVIEAGIDGLRIDLTGTLANTRSGSARGIASLGDANVSAQRIDNHGGAIGATARLEVDAQDIDNRAGSLLGLEGTRLRASGTVDNRQGLLASGADLALEAHALDNRDGAVFGGASVAVDTARLANTGGRIDAAHALTVKAAAFSADGVLAAGGDLGLHTEGDYTHTGILSAGGDLDVSTTGHYVNAGTLSAQGALHLAARQLTNQEQGQILGRELNIDITGEFANAGLVNATGGTARIQAGSLVNTGRIYGDSVVLRGPVRNAPDAQGRGAVIAAREGLLEVDGSLRNEDGSLVLGLGDMDFRDEVSNSGATIHAGGSIRFAKALNNLNPRLETGASLSIEWAEGFYITPEGRTDTYPAAELRWREGIGGRWALPSERYPFDVFGSEIMPSAVEQCDTQGDSGQCSWHPYAADDPVWQRFEVTAPPPPPSLPPGRANCDGTRGDEAQQWVRDTSGACGAYWTALDQHTYESTLAHRRLQDAFDVFNADLEARSILDWFEFRATERHVERPVVLVSQPGQVLAGGSIEVNGGLNQDSLVTAGGQITGVALENRATQGEQRSTEYGQVRFSHREWRGGAKQKYERHTTDWQPTSGGTQVTTFPLDTLTQRGNATVAAPAPQPNPPPAAATPAQLLARAGKPLPPAAQPLPDELSGQLPANLIAAPLRNAQGQAVQLLRTRFATEAANQPLPPQANSAAATRAAPFKGAGYVTVRHYGPIVAPASQLFGRSAPQAGYLVETDPAFTGWREFTSSAAMMAALAMDPERNLKRYGDGFAEQRLIDQQVIALTGQRYLAGYESTEAEYAALIGSGVAFAKRYQLTPGVALTPSQMALLTTDIVWLEHQTVRLPDGRYEQALVPRVYLRRPAEGDLRPDGALIAASDIHLREPDGAIHNSGTLLAHGAANDDGRGVLVLQAQDIANSGALQGNAVFAEAQRDLLLGGGSITGLGSDSLVGLYAARDIVLRTTTQTSIDHLAGPHGSTRVSSTTVDRIATVQADTVAMQADRDIALVGARVYAADTVAMNAKGDLRLDTVQEAYTLDAPLGGEAFGRTGHYRASSQAQVGSEVSAGGNAILEADGEFTARGATLQAGGDMAISGKSVLITGAIDEQSIDLQGVSGNGYSRAAASAQALAGGVVDVGGNLSVTSEQDLTALGASFRAEGELSLNAGRHLTLGTLELSEERQTEYRSESSSVLSSSSRQDQTHERSTYAAGSTVSGNQVVLKAGSGEQGPGHVLIEGSQVVAQKDLTVEATGDVTVSAAFDTYESNASHSQRKSGVGAMGGVSLGTSEQQDSSTEFQQTASASTLGSLEGNLHVTAGGTYRQVGSELVSVQGNIDVEAQRIEVEEARETTRSERHSQARQSGVTVSVSNPVVNAARSVDRMAGAAHDTSDPRLQALAAASAALAVVNAADALTASPDQLGGVDINISLGSSKSRSDSSHASSSAAASSMNAGGSIRLKATGAGAESDIVLQGVQMSAGGDVGFEAEDDVLMRAARNTREDHSQNKSSGGSVGVGVAIGKDGVGFAATGSAQSARGQADGEDVSWTNTRIDVGGTFTLKSGGDTLMQGATVTAERVATQIDGDLRIESLQDTSRYDSQQRSANASGSVGAGTRVSASAGGGASNVHSTYASVNEQSGLFARDGGFDVEVHGRTTLVGGAITTTDKAVAEGRNQFKTEQLVLQDIENKAEYRASAYAVSVGSGQNNDGSRNVQGTSAGYGQDSGSASSVTRAGISGVAGNADARTGDPGTGLARIFDAERVQREIDAQVAITGEFGQQASKAWGNYANRQYLDALKKGDSEAQACWAPNGPCRAGGHAAIGGLTGGVAGAAGAGASSMAAPQLQEALVSAGVPRDVATFLAEAGVTATAAGIGGVQGGAAALNEAGNNFILAAGAIAEGIAAGGAAAARLCVASPSCVATVGMAGAAAIDSIRRLAQSEPAPSGTPGYEPGPARGVGPTALPADDAAKPNVTASPAEAPGKAPVHTGGSPIVASQDTSTVSPANVGGGGSTVVFSEGRPTLILPPSIDQDAAEHLRGNSSGGGHLWPGPPGPPLWSATNTKSAAENALGHWQKHAAEFPEFIDSRQYIEAAHSLAADPPPSALTKTRGADTLIYDTRTNTFVVKGADGAPRTMFRPTDGINYWNKQ